MNTDLFRGKLVRLAAGDPQVFSEHTVRWHRDSEYWRLMASEPAYPHSSRSSKEFFEKMLEADPPEGCWFLIRSLEDDRLLGDIGLDGVDWANGESFVGLGIGEREYWGKGYGTDAMRVLLRYAFSELNLWRISLNVFDYNLRAVRSYEKVGFKVEGRTRGFMRRDGLRRDLIWMSVLRLEWEQRQNE